eukprot:superscaffoldBa00000693_g6612
MRGRLRDKRWRKAASRTAERRREEGRQDKTEMENEAQNRLVSEEKQMENGEQEADSSQREPHRLEKRLNFCLVHSESTV